MTIDIYIEVAAFDEYAGGGIVLHAINDDFTDGGCKRELGIAFGVMAPDDAVLSTAALALASVVPAFYGAQITLHCINPILRNALVLQDLSESVLLTKLEGWAEKFKSLWLSGEGGEQAFERALLLARLAATKQQNYDSQDEPASIKSP